MSIKGTKQRAACKGCLYAGKAGPFWGCDYILIEKKRRPCKPGDGCTVRTVGEKNRKKLFEEAET